MCICLPAAGRGLLLRDSGAACSCSPVRGVAWKRPNTCRNDRTKAVLRPYRSLPEHAAAVWHAGCNWSGACPTPLA